MSEEQAGSRLHIDSDWKAEAAREKERLVQEEQQQREQQASQMPSTPPGAFEELVNILAMQAAIGLGGMQAPGGERIPPDPAAAKRHIDLLDVLEKKTKGNLTETEKVMLDAILHELRLQYVQTVSASMPGGGMAPPGMPEPS